MAVPLADLGVEVSIVLLDTINNRARVKLECPEANILWFSQSNMLLEVMQKNRLIKKLNPDLVYVSTFGFRNFILDILSKRRIYVVEHSELGSSFKDSTLLKRSSVLMLEYVSVLLFSGHIVASMYLKKHYENHSIAPFIGKRKILYSPYAYSTQLNKVDVELSNLLKKQIKGRKVITYMGTLVRNYGIFEIIKAVEQLTKKYNNFLLVVIGGGVDKDFMLSEIRSKNLDNYVHVAGYVDEKYLATYFWVTDVFIAPLKNTIQDWARCPSKIFMYLPFNKPIVTCDIGESRVLFSEQDFFYQPEDAKSMANALSNAMAIEKDWEAHIDVNLHTWDYRAGDFLNWVSVNWGVVNEQSVD
jgi:glycosyltransferase involved in cell wall biosynthesis